MPEASLLTQHFFDMESKFRCFRCCLSTVNRVCRRLICRLASQIIISDPSTGQKVATLEGHESYVKGLAWDPVCKPSCWPLNILAIVTT